MDIEFWCSARHHCTPSMWNEDHPHEPWSKLYILRQGRASYGIARDGAEPRLQPLRPGHLHLIPGGCRHRHSCTAPFVLDWCHFTIADHGLGRRLAGLAAMASWPLDEVLPPAMQDRTVRCAHHTPADRLLAAGLVLQLLGRLPEPPGDDVDAGIRRRLEPATWWLSYHYHEPVTVASLAQRAGLKPSRFQQLFRRLHGTGVYAHLLRLRLDEAQRLLATTAMPVQEVAARVGYPNPFHFTRLFARHQGVNPSAYRVRARRAVPPEPGVLGNGG